MKRINYNKRQSKFYETLDKQIDFVSLNRGSKLAIKFNDRAYDLSERLIIIEQEIFLCEFSNNDVSRFPSRVKALASYLRSKNSYGKYIVSNVKEQCTLQLLSSSETTIVDSLMASSFDETEKLSLISSRIGQGKYREALIAKNECCPLTGTSDERFLIASHIKPWRVCSNLERLDPENGFLLSPHIDLLFDRGFISFSDDGKLLAADTTIERQIEEWSIEKEKSSFPFSDRKKSYLAYHREYVFRN